MKRSFRVRVLHEPVKKIASGAVVSLAVIASVASNPPPPCGDGSTTGGFGINICDDGNLVNGDGCDETCSIEPGFECSDPLAIEGASVCAPTACGNGLSTVGEFQTNINEECDEGANNSDTTPNACRTDCSRPVCGDGLVDDLFDEQCDDAALNADTPDSCRTDCLLPSCGDSIVDSNEQCDDGNVLDDDGCSAGCLVELCGD